MIDIKELTIFLEKNNCDFFNLDKIENNNIFLTGLSGSGKSTLCNKLSSYLNFKVIHLDDFWVKQIAIKNNFENLSDEEITNFFITFFNTKKHCIIEGVQILMFSENKWDYFLNKPLIFLNTDIYTSTNQAFNRGDISKDLNIIIDNNYDLLLKFSKFKEYLKNR